MFTGIIQNHFPIKKIVKKTGLWTFFVLANEGFCRDLKIGASVALDGVCMTVVEVENNIMKFDAMSETLEKTTLGLRTDGDMLNVERSARMGDEIGGHIVSGHVSGMAEIADIKESENNKEIFFKLPSEFMKYVFYKGFIALDGASLTIVECDKNKNIISVCFIPETLQKTGFGVKKIGDRVNFEIDGRTQVIVDTIKNNEKNADKC